MTSDLELLEQYGRDKQEDAFATLLDRHLPLVYSAALRQVRSPQLAEEIAQSVFVDLCQQAGRLKRETVLPAWLYQVTRRASVDVIRRESRRQARERIAADMSQLNTPSSEWTAIEPLLDEAMESLDATDRTAILLRFFQEKSLREVGQALGSSEDAAQKRIGRALDRLREFFSRRGKTVGVGGLATVISANAAKSAPVSLKAAILKCAVISPIGTIAITKTIAMTTFQKALIGAAFVAVVGAGIYETQRAASLRQDLETFQRQQKEHAADRDAVRQRMDEDSRELAALRAENDKLRQAASEVIRLRGEVGRLRDNATASGDPSALAMKAWLTRVTQLKDRIAQNPNLKIPEFKYLSEEDWLAAARNELNSDDDYRRAMSTLRNSAESTFMSEELNPALHQYMADNKNQFPTDLSQLQPYFDPPVDDSILQRWQITPKSTVPNVGVGDPIITQIAPVDAENDNRFVIGPQGFGSSGGMSWNTGTTPAEILMPVFKAYAAANNGAEPANMYQLTPYATTPEQSAALQKVISQVLAK